jgi:hypothetical protein
MGGRWLVFLVGGALTISVTTVFAAANIPALHPVRFNLQAYNISVAFEAILIAIAVVVLTRSGRKFLLLPVISIIVGLHFYGMVWALGSNEYWWIGSAMCALPVFTVLFVQRDVWTPVVGFGCAIILWTSVI